MARNKFDVDETLESPFQWKHLKRAFQYSSRHRFQMLGALGLSVLASICTLYTPKIMSKVLDEVGPEPASGPLSSDSVRQPSFDSSKAMALPMTPAPMMMAS